MSAAANREPCPTNNILLNTKWQPISQQEYESNMARDIEEFLKMAAQRRQQQRQQQQAGGAQRQPRPATPPVQRLASQLVTPATEDEIQILDDTSGQDMRHQTVSGHVETHIDTSEIAQHTRQLGQKVGMADDKLEARLQQKFDHDVGHLQIDQKRSAQSETTSVTETDLSEAAAALMQMLRTPTSIRQAILISEVLKRPEFDY